jgi:hypothetical protein
MNDKPVPQPASRDALAPELLSALMLDIEWFDFRSSFRQRMVDQGYLVNRWRSPLEADVIMSFIAMAWAKGEAITLKELASLLGEFVSNVTVKRLLDDMEASGTIIRQTDASDRRRVLLIPTERLAEIGQIFLSARIEIARRRGFVYDPERAAAQAPEIAVKL